MDDGNLARSWLKMELKTEISLSFTTSSVGSHLHTQTGYDACVRDSTPVFPPALRSALVDQHVDILTCVEQPRTINAAENVPEIDMCMLLPSTCHHSCYLLYMYFVGRLRPYTSARVLKVKTPFGTNT